MPRLGETPDAVRGRRPPIAEAFERTRADVLEGGLVDPALKRRCAAFLADEPFERNALDGRERAALDWAQAIAYDADGAGDELWERLHAHFSEPELAELGYTIAFTLGQQHWLRSLDHAATS